MKRLREEKKNNRVIDRNADIAGFYNEIRENKIFHQYMESEKKKAAAENRREQLEEEKKEAMHNNKIKWQVFRVNRDQVVSKFMQAKKKSVRGT